MRTILLTFLYCLSSFSLYAQTSKIKPLQIGDMVPEAAMPKIGMPGHTGDVSTAEPSLIILDFWSIMCISCIKDFPKLEALQQQFGDKIRIVLVTKNKDTQVEQLFAKLKKIKRPALMMINGDTVLSKLFPYVAVPHHVWIGWDRRVRHITSSYGATTASIQAELDGKEQQLYKKMDVKKRYVTLPYDGNDERLLYYSYLMKKVKGLYGLSDRNFIKDSITGKMQGLHVGEGTIVDLYKIAYGEDLIGGKFIYPNSVELQVKNPAHYLQPEDPLFWDDWKDANSYRYTLKVPPNQSGALFTIMKRELENLFGLTGIIENKKVKCLVLKRTHPEISLLSAGGKKYTNYYSTVPEFILVNLPLSGFMNSVAFYQKLQVIDETNFSGMADLELHARLDDREALNRELRKYGLFLVEELRERPVLVLREK